MSVFFSTMCPYCKYPKTMQVDPSKHYGSEIVLCGDSDDEESGCNKYYAVFWRANIRAEPRSIEQPEED